MEDEYIFNLAANTNLFRYDIGRYDIGRYDIGRPPLNWDERFHNPQYHSDQFGEKNQIGAIFLYDNEQCAVDTGKVALEESEDSKKIFITLTQNIRDLRLFNIPRDARVSAIIYILDSLGIDVLTKDFSLKYYQKDHDTLMLSEVRNLCNRLNLSTNCVEKLQLGSSIGHFFCEESFGNRHFGQFLTDFNNGNHFKSMLVEHQFDGYCFVESQDGTRTICIFDKDNLIQPQIIHEI